MITASAPVDSVEREVDVRRRHARFARALQEAALQRLIAIKPDELTPKLAIEMMRIGVDFEREALGLGDVAPNLHHDGEDQLRLRKAVETATAIMAKHARAGHFGNAAKQA